MKLLCRTAALVFSAAAVSWLPAQGQQYATPAPVPRTTALPQLHALARAREIKERFMLGVADEQRGDYAAALPEFERVVDLHPPEPQHSTALYDAGIAYANLHRLPEAAKAFEAAIAADPGFLAAMANLVAVDIALGDTNGARNAADRFVRAAPDSARALYSRGLVALQQNDLATARADFSQLLRNDPKYALAHYDLGVTEARAGRWTSAQREFALALDISPGYARARFALGTVLLREGKRADARTAFEQVVRDANGDVALQNLAQAMRDAIHAP